VARLRAAGSVFAEDEADLLVGSGATGAALDRLVERRVAGEPLEVLVGWVAFLGRRLVVAPGVFVPRRRTELLARLAASYAGDDAVLVELCCGVAPVAAVVEVGEVHAADVSEDALACAARNAPHAALHRGDLYDALPTGLRGRVDVLAANAPYVPSERVALMPPEARVHEPRVALDGGADGVDLHRRIAAGAPDWLAPGGVLLIETSPAQAPLTAAAMGAAGLHPDVVTDDDVAGCVVRGVRSAEPG
jgi:release factor glutamine methyltransferase